MAKFNWNVNTQCSLFDHVTIILECYHTTNDAENVAMIHTKKIEKRLVDVALANLIINDSPFAERALLSLALSFDIGGGRYGFSWRMVEQNFLGRP